jgi:predicted NAD/FAD-dependent oxidoreductase
MKSPLLVGNGFAVLASAVELAGRGQQVTLLTDGKPLGGHFAGIQLEGHDFDIGMVFVEENTPTEPGADLRGYDPVVRNDWARFGDRTSAWIRSKVQLVRVQTPECLVEGRRVADYLISNRLDGLIDAPNPPLLSRSDPRHAVHKCHPGVFDTLTYAEASKWNHGQVWHQRFIEPFVKKVFSVESSDFLARFHRAGWVPLYYPETLQLAASGLSTGLNEYPFWTTPNGFVGQLVKNLRYELTQLPNVSVITHSLVSVSYQHNQWTILTSDGKDYRNSHLVLGLTADRTSTLLGLPGAAPLPTATVSLLFVMVKAECIRSSHGCTMIVDDAYAAYRLTDHDMIAGLSPSWHRLVLEASPQAIARLHPGKTLEDALLYELANLIGMDAYDQRDRAAIHVLRCLTAQNIFPIPTVEQIYQANQTASLFAKAAPGATFTGNLLGYGVASLNDQVIQALKISEELA